MTKTASNRDIDDFMDFAHKAVLDLGRSAMAFYGKGEKSVKFDEGLVTETELRLSTMFEEKLKRHFPEHRLFSGSGHGQEAYTHEGRRYLWALDPMDGVANIQAGIPIWGVSISLMENFWPIFGMFHMPATGDFFHAKAGGKAFRGDQPICVSDRNGVDDESLLLTYSRFNQFFSTNFPGKIRNLGSSMAHICYVAMGRAEAAVIRNESFQGLSAGRILIESAGGRIRSLDGSEFHLNAYLDGKGIDAPLLVSGPKLFQPVADFLKVRTE